MSFEAEAARPGRLALHSVEIDYPFCANTYGVSPCTASDNRHNLLTDSNGLAAAGWTKFRATITANAIAAPSDVEIPPGVADSFADRITPTTENNSHHVRQAFDPGAAEGACLSVYAKADGYTGLLIAVRETSPTVNLAAARCDLLTGAIQRDAGTPLSIGAEPHGNGWFRFWVSGEGFDPAKTPIIDIEVLESVGGSQAYAGDGTSSVLIWGPQVTRGTRPGLYTPTGASVVDGGAEVLGLCHNTFQTCQDQANYVEEGKTLIFTPMGQLVPKGVEGIASVRDISWASTVLKPGEGLGARASVRITLQDHTDPDHLLDKYDAERQAAGETSGTFWGRIKARQPFLIGRALRVREGYVSPDGTFSALTRVRHYIIDDVSGPDDKGAVTITAKDILKLADDKRARAPVESTGKLTSDINNSPSTTSIPVTTGTGPDYDVDKHIIIDEEIMEITSRTVDTLTVVRAAGGTAIAEHKTGALVQSCLTFEDKPVIEVQQTLFQTFAGISSSFIPFTDWQAEQTLSLDDYKLSTIIPKPEGVTKLIKEIDEATLIDNWWEDVDQEIELKLQTPYQEDVPLLTDDEHFIAESITVRDRNDLRLSRAFIWYGMRNYADDLDPENMSYGVGNIELDKEGANKYGDSRTKVIISRWLRGPSGTVGTQDNTTAAQLTVQRLTDRFGVTPQEFTFLLDAKDADAIRVGTVVDVQTRILQDRHGEPQPVRMQIVEARPEEAAHQYRMKALGFFQDPESQGDFVISADTSDVDLFVAFGGPPGPVTRTVVVNAGVTVHGTHTNNAGGAAITTGNLHPDSVITFQINGEVAGAGGPGGDGGSPLLGIFGTSGTDGGAALDIKVGQATVTGSGTLNGGGGGGGGGAGGSSGGLPTFGGGGGGGRGYNNAPGGSSPDGSADGGDGSGASAGSGGTSAGGNGGGGGDWGAAGASGSPGFGGGAAGPAVQTNGNSVTFTFTGTVNGGIV